MLFFGKKKDSAGLSRGYVDFLNEVDLEYMRAYATRSTRKLSNYLTRECMVKVSQSIYSIGSRYFGAEKFRQTNWTVIQESDIGTVTIMKSVVFDKVKVTGALAIDVAEDYSEIWRLETTGKELRVADIQVVT